MKISIKVIPGAKLDKIVQLSENELKVWLTAKPVENEANEKLIKVLSKYFFVPKSSISIVKGRESRNKIVEIGS